MERAACRGGVPIILAGDAVLSGRSFAIRVPVLLISMHNCADGARVAGRESLGLTRCGPPASTSYIHENGPRLTAFFSIDSQQFLNFRIAASAVGLFLARAIGNPQQDIAAAKWVHPTLPAYVRVSVAAQPANPRSIWQKLHVHRTTSE